jgi:hypothetical protein
MQALGEVRGHRRVVTEPEPPADHQDIDIENSRSDLVGSGIILLRDSAAATVPGDELL